MQLESSIGQQKHMINIHMDKFKLPTGLLVKKTKTEKNEHRQYGGMLNDYFFNKFFTKVNKKTRKNYT